MADKETKLSIVIRTVDQATAKIKAINAQLDAATKPIRDFKKSLGELREKSGLDDVIGGFKGVGSAIGNLLSKVALVGGAVGLVVGGVMHLIGEFDDLGDKAERFGVSVDFLAAMRYAAEKAGAPVEALDGGLQSLSINLGKLSAGTGRMKTFLDKVSPALERQLKGAKSNEEAFYLLAAAMDKLKDPSKRAALAAATLGDASLAPLLNKGEAGIKELAARYAELAPGMGDAADKAGAVDDSMHDLKASTDGVKAAIVSGLAPALKIIVDQLTVWFTSHRADIKEWAAQIGKKLPAAFNAVVGAIGTVIDRIKPFVDNATKLKVILGVVAAFILGPLISSLVSLGIALVTNPIFAVIAAIALGAALLISNWGAVSEFFNNLWDGVSAKFGWFAHVVKLVLWPFLGLATLFIGAWEPVSGFFVGLWDGIVSVFQSAWNVIKGIVDDVRGAVDFVSNAVDKINPFGGPSVFDQANTQINGSSPSDVIAQTMRIADASRGRADAAKITVDFANAPRGTRVKTDPQSTADVDLSVGYQMLGQL